MSINLAVNIPVAEKRYLNYLLESVYWAHNESVNEENKMQMQKRELQMQRCKCKREKDAKWKFKVCRLLNSDNNSIYSYMNVYNYTVWEWNVYPWHNWLVFINMFQLFITCIFFISIWMLLTDKFIYNRRSSCFNTSPCWQNDTKGRNLVSRSRANIPFP